MSADHSWICLSGLGAQEMLGLAGLEETGEVGSPLAEEDGFSYTSLADGRLVLFANCFDLHHEELLEQLSRSGELMLCSFSDDMDEPSASLAVLRKGSAMWQVQATADSLSVWGEAPPELSELNQRFNESINEDRRMMDEMLFALAERLCGFRHDRAGDFRMLRRLPNSPLVPVPDGSRASKMLGTIWWTLKMWQFWALVAWFFLLFFLAPYNR